MVLKLLVVGTSFGSTYLKAAHESQNWEIGGIVARTEKSVRKTGRKFGVPEARQFTDLDRALNDLSEIDAVVIAVPNNLHYKFAKKVLEHNKHLILEKPIVETWEQAMDLVKILDTKPALKAMVGQTLRGVPMIRLTEYAINKKNILGSVEHLVLSSHWYWTGDPEKQWRFKLPHMFLDDIGIHQLDEIRMLLNNRKCISVIAEAFTPRSYPLPIKTTISAALHFEDDIHVNYFASMGARGYNLGWYGEVKIFGTEGAIIRDPEGVPNFYPASGLKRNKAVNLVKKLGKEFKNNTDLVEFEKIAYLLEDFYFAISDNRAPVTDLHDNINTFAILLAIKRSAELGRKIVIEEEFPADY